MMCEIVGGLGRGAYRMSTAVNKSEVGGCCPCFSWI